MSNGRVIAICVARTAGEPMQQIESVLAIAEEGLQGDRYASGEGSFNKDRQGSRQVTLINGLFFEDSGFEHVDSRRNIVTLDVELMWLIGRQFKIGEAYMSGIKYCDPCQRPSKLQNKSISFAKVFHDRGGLVAEVIQSGLIRVGDAIVPPPKGY